MSGKADGLMGGLEVNIQSASNQHSVRFLCCRDWGCPCVEAMFMWLQFMLGGNAVHCRGFTMLAAMYLGAAYCGI